MDIGGKKWTWLGKTFTASSGDDVVDTSFETSWKLVPLYPQLVTVATHNPDRRLPATVTTVQDGKEKKSVDYGSGGG